MAIQALILFFALDSLPPAPVLHTALDQYHDSYAAAQLEAFDESTTGMWMNYFPSVGIAYTPAGQPRPGISFSLAQIFSAKKQARETKAKREALRQQLELLREADHQRLDAMLRTLEKLKLQEETAWQLLEIETKLLELAEADYEEAKIGPEAFLTRRKSVLSSRQSLLSIQHEIERQSAEIASFAHFPELETSPQDLSNR